MGKVLGLHRDLQDLSGKMRKTEITVSYVYLLEVSMILIDAILNIKSILTMLLIDAILNRTSLFHSFSKCLTSSGKFLD